MAYNCSHSTTVTNIPVSTILSSKELVCADCECTGPNLWICLHSNCLKVGCSENYNDHSSLHNKAQPSHCIHMNLSTNRVWCYECTKEVFPTNQNHQYDSDQETETVLFRSRDSGNGSYSTLRTNTPDRNSIPNMSGDTSESSDGEDTSDYNIDRPTGLVGLQNIGNTCYMNAALQALSNTIPLTKFFLECPAAVQILSEGRKPGLSRTYQALMRDIWNKKNTSYITPSGILYGIRIVHAMFRGYHQHDTQEFLRNFMDQLHEELKQVQLITTSTTLPIADPHQSAKGPSIDNFSMAIDEASALSSSYDSSEGEYETCDSGVSERSSLSDDTEKPNGHSKRRLSRSTSPGRRLRARLQSAGVIDSQPGTSNNNITTTCNSSKKQVKHRSIISDIFDGKLLSSVQCLTCDRISSRVETFQDLSLPIPSKDHLVVLHGRSTSAPNSTTATMCSDAVMPVQDGWISWILAWFKSWFYGPMVTLHDCLAAFFSTDELKGDNMYSCEKCNKLRNGIKFSKVLQLPEILCIHLKRFRHELMFSSKISAVVSFPLKGLDMRPYLHTECTSKVTNYELFSVICHHGTAGGGHYICYALNSNQWYEFDDQYVTRVSPEKVQSCEAYVLFYRKVSNISEDVRCEATRINQECTTELSTEAFLISKQWLSRFNTCCEPGPIDNSDFLCQHGSINPDIYAALNQLTVIVPLEVYDFLYSKFGGDPPTANLNKCGDCLEFQEKLLQEKEKFLQISRKVQDLNLPASHILSTSWYTRWHNYVNRKTDEPPGPIDNSKINVNQCFNNDYSDIAEVSELIWNFFFNKYGGGPEILINNEEMQIESESSAPPSDVDETPEFFVPNLKNHSKERKEIVDRSMYSHGEPMETEVIKENGVAELSDKDDRTEDVTMDAATAGSCDTTAVVNNAEVCNDAATNHHNNNNNSNTNSNSVNNGRFSNCRVSSAKHRRRRMAKDYS